MTEVEFQNLTSDATVIQSLSTLGPIGLAMIAAYLAGQGLVKLAEKIQLMSRTGATPASLSPEEYRQVQEAIEATRTEIWAKANPEQAEWIIEHPPVSHFKASPEMEIAMEDLDNNLSKLMINCPPEGPKRDELCNRIRAIMGKIEQIYEKTPGAFPLIDSMFGVAYKWLKRKCGGLPRGGPSISQERFEAYQ